MSSKRLAEPVDHISQATVPVFYDMDDESTYTIDLRTLFSKDVTTSGSFDMRRMKLASFARFLQALSVPTLLITPSHAIAFANDVFKKLPGTSFDPERLTFASLFPNLRQARQAQLLLEEVFRNRKPAVRETALQIEKTRIWARIHLRTIRFGESQMVLVQIENLSAQRQLVAIKKYKKLVTIFPIGIAEFLMREPLAYSRLEEKTLHALTHARVVDGNIEFARMYKREDVKDLMGLPLGRLFPCEGKAKEVYNQWIRSGFRVFPFETKYKASAGNVRYFEDTLIGRVAEGTLFGFWWLKKDVSQNKKIQEEVLKARKLESLGILAGGIAHDFNNLLTAILGNISLARYYLNPTDKAFDRISAAMGAVSRAQDLTRQLLTFSKGGAPVKTTASIAGLLEDCATFVLRGSKVNCKFTILKDLWRVEVDEGQISQVISNLVINAAQAMPQGGTVHIRADNIVVNNGHRIPLKKGRYVRIAVKDSGVGIPQEHIGKIFDPYFTTKETGTGLGLATAYSIIQKHDGAITVDTKLGNGTTFSVFLPACAPEVLTGKRKSTKALVTRVRILLMDDEEYIRDLAGEVLTTFGYDPAFAKNGAEAIEMYISAMRQGQPFSAVIMDLTVPGAMGGKEAIKKIREIDPNVKAIVSSGYSNDPVMSEFCKYGFKGILPKPYAGTELIAALDNVLKATDVVP